MAKKTKELTIEEKLENALVPDWEQPYKLPENWCWTYIKSGYDVTSSKRVHKNDWLSEGIPFYRTRELVKLSNLGYVDNELFISEEMYNSFKSQFGVPQIDDILISGVGTIGVPYIIKDDAKLYFKDGNVIWFKNKGLFDASYVYYLYKGLFIGNQISNMSSGSTVDTYTIINANKTKLPLPPLAEQKRIVDRIESLFSKLDEAKDIAQKALDSFENRKSAILHKAFTGELTKKWREGNKHIDALDGLKEFSLKQKKELRSEFEFWHKDYLPAGWCESRIGNCLYYAGRVGWKGLKAQEYTVDGPLLLSVYNLNDGDEVSYSKAYHISEERYNESPEIMIQTGDILLTKDGAGIGKLGYVKELPQAATINSSLLLIRPNEIIISKYIYYLLSGPQLQSIVKERITGSATPHLFQRDIKEFNIAIPSIEEQQEIVRILDSIFEKEKEAEELISVIEKIDLIKKSILSKAFRGELGTNDEEEESSVGLLREMLGNEPEQLKENKKAKTISVPKNIQKKLSNDIQRKIYKYIVENGEVSLDDIIPVGKKPFEVLDALRTLKEEKLIIEKDNKKYIIGDLSCK